MRAIEFALVLAVLSAAVWVIAGPLRSGRHGDRERELDPAPPSDPADGLAALQAAKEAKYREIRDAELDFRTGKLSEADHRALDTELRAEAMDILRALDAAEDQDRASRRTTL